MLLDAVHLMQVIPGYHKDRLEAAGVDSVLDPHDNIRLGAHILKEYIRRGGTEVAGLQIYNGSADDATNAYAVKVLAEKQRLQQAVQRLRDRLRALTSRAVCAPELPEPSTPGRRLARCVAGGGTACATGRGVAAPDGDARGVEELFPRRGFEW
jgi:hypothetical protein